jgi:hypothetical protein
MSNKLKSHKPNLKTVEFKERDEILFPDMCIICGKTTDSRFEKRLYGKFVFEKPYKKNYNFSLPICSECKRRLKIKSGLNNIFGKLIVISVVIAIISGIILGVFTHSIIMPITILIISFLIPLFFYWRSTKDKLKLDNYFKIQLVPGQEDTIRLSFLNSEYTEFIKKTNLNN